jgi:hypothetical protein
MLCVTHTLHDCIVWVARTCLCVRLQCVSCSYVGGAAAAAVAAAAVRKRRVLLQHSGRRVEECTCGCKVWLMCGQLHRLILL